MNMKGYILLASLLLPAALMAQPVTSGQYIYTGAPVNLTEHTFKCDHLLKLQGTDKEAYQGMDIWGDYIFSCQNSGWLTVYKIDGEKITRECKPFKLASYDKVNHANVATFGRTFYDKDDRFPLLYVSQCNRNPINGRKDVLYVERVANDLKSSELVQTIYFKDTDHLFGYALQWVIDPDNNYLYGYGNTVDNTNALNRHRIVKFRIPKLNESTDGLVTLTKDDLLENYLIEDTYQTHFNPIGQGLFIKNGQLFMPTGFGKEKQPSILYVWNLNTRTMQNVIDLTKATFGEARGLRLLQGRPLHPGPGRSVQAHFLIPYASGAVEARITMNPARGRTSASLQAGFLNILARGVCQRFPLKKSVIRAEHSSARTPA